MKEKKITLKFTSAHFSDLDKQDQQLIENAQEAFKTAYAPYSGFLVGASILLENGEIVNGSNQENVAYPSGLCAERVAMFYVGSKFPDVKIDTIAVSVFSKDFEVTDIISPCGACRQVMAEYEDKQKKSIKVILHSPNNQVLISRKVQDLLPFMFKSSHLKKY